MSGLRNSYYSGRRKKTLSMIVGTPVAEGNVLIGAGVFTDEDIGLGSKRIHRGRSIVIYL